MRFLVSPVDHVRIYPRHFPVVVLCPSFMNSCRKRATITAKTEIASLVSRKWVLDLYTYGCIVWVDYIFPEKNDQFRLTI